MKTLVSVVHNQVESADKFWFGPHLNIIYQKMSEDWNLLDDSVFAVSCFFLVVAFGF